MRVALVANPRSGPGDRARAVADALRRGGAEVVEVPLEALGPPDAPDPDAVDLEGAERVVLAGGDGSIGPAAVLAGHHGVPLAVVPSGTANDFARAMRLPRGLARSCALALGSRRTRRVELADADGRPFVNAASAGLSPQAARLAAPLKARLGPLAYPVGAVRAAIAGSPQEVAVACDGQAVFRGACWQVTVAATGAFGGGAATGGTRADDGRLDVAIVEDASRVALLRRARAMRAGRLVHEPRVAHHRGREVRVEAPPDAPWNVDGEACALPHGRFGLRGRVEVVVP